MGRHGALKEEPDEPGPIPRVVIDRMLRRLALTQAGINFAVALFLVIGEPGSSPAIAFLMLVVPLPFWGIGYGAVAVLLLIRQNVAGHTLAAFLWVFLAAGAVLGVATGSTGSPTASLILTTLVAGMSGFHLNGLWFRRGEKLADRDR